MNRIEILHIYTKVSRAHLSIAVDRDLSVDVVSNSRIWCGLSANRVGSTSGERICPRHLLVIHRNEHQSVPIDVGSSCITRMTSPMAFNEQTIVQLFHDTSDHIVDNRFYLGRRLRQPPARNAMDRLLISCKAWSKRKMLRFGHDSILRSSPSPRSQSFSRRPACQHALRSCRPYVITRVVERQVVRPRSEKCCVGFLLAYTVVYLDQSSLPLRFKVSQVGSIQRSEWEIDSEQIRQ